jgi:membrane protein required for colicin V production
VTIDLAVLAVLAVAALRGALTGALRQLVSLAAISLGVIAARALAAEVAAGLSRMGAPAARALAPVLLFVGIGALASLAGVAVLKATGVSRVVRGPADRGAGALLGGAKGALAAWLVLSAVALVGDRAPDAVLRHTRGSDFTALAHDHNLVSRLRPDAARALEKVP